jgi:hypothetical protein
VPGNIGTWQFFHGEVTRRLTPLLLEKVGSEFVIRGVGATRASSGMGAQEYDFELVAGTDLIGDNFYFGWKDGGNGVNNAGVSEYDAGGPGVLGFGGSFTTFYVGDSLGSPSTVFNRTYSVSATAVPEPGTAVLAGIGTLVLAFAARARRRKA